MYFRVLCFAMVLGLMGQGAASSVVWAMPAAQQEELALAVGENKVISAADVKSYSEGAPGIVDVKLTPNGAQFVIVGRKPGSTTLLLIRKDGVEVTWNVHVFQQSVSAVESELGELLGTTPGVRFRRVGARFFIEGGVSSEAELKRIEHIAGLYSGQVESLVVLGGAAADRKINVRVDVFFVQYNKQRSYQIGLGFPGSIGADTAKAAFGYDFLAGHIVSATASIVDQPLPTLDLAARNGWAKVLKHATVVASNGTEASFSNGGQQNFPVTNGLTASIQKIQFGTEIKVLPRFDPGSQEIEVAVGADVSDLTPPQGDTKLPGQNTAALSTVATLRLGQSLVLSGIRTEADRRTKAGLPWLSEIPVIGALFGSHGRQSEEVEGAIFVVPSVVESAPRRAAELIDHALSEYERFDGDMRTVAPFDEAIADPTTKKSAP